MNYWKTLLPATVAVLIAAQAAAQTDADKIEVKREQEVVTQEVAERNAEVETPMQRQ